MADYAFLFTDIEGSSRLWETYPDAMEAALAEHDALLRAAIEAVGGAVFSTMGDGMAAAFAHVDDAVRAAADGQRALAAHAWSDTGPLRVRMGVHVGPAQRRGDDYFGRTLNRCARLMAVGHGGQVLLSGAAVSAASINCRDLGVHRLRDLGEPEHIFQLLAEDLVSDFPPLVTLDARPGNLPSQTTSFVGRDAEVADALEDLDAGRVVTLTGVGGVGKTRLALQVAAEATARFPDGAWLCELAPVGDPDAVAHALAGVFGVQPDGGGSIRDALLARLESSTLLIVLDNCEHVLDAVGSLVEDIVHRCAHVTMLATSREPLGVDGEKIRVVRSLAASASAQLFADRARAIRADVRAADDDAVDEICARLDGVPLAIELAAARVASMTPAEISARLDERFRLLTGGRRTAVERHRTLRGAVDWSYGLLQPAEQRVFCRLAVFAGGFSLEAAEAVGDDAEILVIDALQSLVQKSMVVAELGPDEHHYRYAMLETLRQYAEEQLASASEADVTRRRHAEYFADLAERGSRGEKGRDEPAWAARLEAELGNFRAAIAWSTATGDATVSARLVASLDMHAFFHLWSEFDSWARTVTELLSRAPDVDGDLAARAEAGAAVFAWGGGDNERALRLVDRACARDGRSDTTDAVLHIVVASVALATGDVDAAVHADKNAVEVARRTGDDWWVGFNLAHLCLSTAASSNITEAVALGRQALTAARVNGSPMAIAYAAFALGDVIIDTDPDEAVRVLEEASAAVDAANVSFMRALVRASLVAAQGRSADPRRAISGYLELLDEWRTAGTVVHLRATIRNAAEMLSRLGRLDLTALVRGAMQAWGSAPPEGSPEARRLEVSTAAARDALGLEFGELADRGKGLSDDDLVAVVREALVELEG